MQMTCLDVVTNTNCAHRSGLSQHNQILSAKSS